MLIAGQGKEEDGGSEAQGVGNQRGDDEELGELARRPGAFQVTAAMAEGEAGNGKSEDVALNEGRCQEGPGVAERELGDQVEIGDDDVGVSGPLAIADGGAQY